MLNRLVVLTVFLLSAMGALPSVAQERGGLFTVSDVKVDVSGATTTDARERAFAEGQVKAFQMLLDRLGVDQSRFNAGMASEIELGQVLRSFQVDQESTTAGRYMATLTYQFRPDEVRELLRSRSIDFAATVSKPVVVIPVYRSPAGPRLWDSPNPWLDAWLDFPGGEGFVPVIVPFGDLQDIRDITTEQAMAGDRAAIEAIVSRYEAGSAIVAVAEPRDGAIDVSYTRYDLEFGDTMSSVTVDQGADEPTMLAEATRQVSAQLEAAWRDRTRIQSGQRSTLALLVPLRGDGSDWFSIQRRLRQVSTIVATRVVSLSPYEAVLEVDYVGDQEQFRLALAQRDLMLEQGSHAPQLRLAEAGSVGFP
jgi:hypothetical protein